MVQNPESASPDPQTPPPSSAATEIAGEQLLSEIRLFRADCLRRRQFNNGWDIVLSVLGILLSIAVVGAGFLKRPEISAVLGAVVGAVVTAQKAFPFGQRSNFYRLLLGQTDNLLTRATQGLWNKKEVVDTLSTLRMDYAQQLPRGSSAATDSNPAHLGKQAQDVVPSAPADAAEPTALR